MNVKLTKFILQTVYPSYMQKIVQKISPNPEALSTIPLKTFFSMEHK